MKYSIIIPYRDREDNLKILLPRLQEVFANEEDAFNDFFRIGLSFVPSKKDGKL